MDVLGAIGKIIPQGKPEFKFQHDETPGLVGTKPLAVLYPTSHEEVIQLAKICHEHKTPMVPRGGGTGKAGGCVPIKSSVVVCFEKMNRIISTHPEDLTMCVQPGVILQDLKKVAASHQLMFPPDPGCAEGCMIGGNVATNAGGPSAFKYGSTRDYVLGMKIVTSNGTEHVLGKNTLKGVAGYDLTSLLVGSEGTLAFITEITLRLIPKPKVRGTALIPFLCGADAGKAIAQITSTGLRPSKLEYIDEISIKAVQKAGIAAMIPKSAKACLLVEFDGVSDEDVAAQMEGIYSQDDSMIVALDIPGQRNLWAMREGLSEACKKYLGRKISEDICVPTSQIPEMIEVIQNLGSKYNLLTCAFGHAGDGNLHVQMLFENEGDATELSDLLGKLFQKTVELGGTITGEHGIGIAKMSYLPLEQSRGIIALQKSIRKLFDPAGLMNPGKIFPE